jgi:FtsP/CotA-like multicopper oxidase with cupredoxin domain
VAEFAKLVVFAPTRIRMRSTPIVPCPWIHRALRASAVLVAAATTTLAPCADASQPKAFTLPLVEGALHGASDTVRVKQGDDVELRWTTDRPVTLHLHGYDIESRIAPGKPVLMSFKATLPGRFPVEVHGGGKGPHRPVLYLEVYP